MPREKLPRSHPEVPLELDRYLVPSEIIIFQKRLHWLALWKPIFATVGGLFLLIYLDGKVSDDVPYVRGVLGLLWILAVGWLVVAAILWYREWFFGTDRRLMLTMGIITRKVAMMPLAKVTDMSYERTVGGRLFGYGTFVLESAGQDQALSTIKFIPEPDILYRRINEVLFSSTVRRAGDRPAASAGRLPVQETADAWWRRR